MNIFGIHISLTDHAQQNKEMAHKILHLSSEVKAADALYADTSERLTQAWGEKFQVDEQLKDTVIALEVANAFTHACLKGAAVQFDELQAVKNAMEVLMAKQTNKLVKTAKKAVKAIKAKESLAKSINLAKKPWTIPVIKSVTKIAKKKGAKG